MGYIICFIIGGVIGGIVGVLAMALCAVAGREDRKRDRIE